MQKRILSTLLNELDGIGTQANSQVYILAATNDPERLDSALIRPGRIDVVLTLDHPSDSCLKDIFTKATEEMPLENGVSFSTITEFSPELSELALTCADIVQICQNAAMCAFYDERDLILKTDFQKASSQFLHNLTSLY